MKPFDLEAFKAGMPAITRRGVPVYFGEHDPDDVSSVCRLFVLTDRGNPESGYWTCEDGRYYDHKDSLDDVVGMLEGFPLPVVEGEAFPELVLGPIEPPVQVTEAYTPAEDYHSPESLADMELPAGSYYGYDLAEGPDTTASVLVNHVPEAAPSVAFAHHGTVMAGEPHGTLTAQAGTASREADPHGKTAHTPGAKLDAGKLRAGLVLGDFARALAAVAEVGTFGANKYTDHGWLSVPDGAQRYEDAKLRHWLKRASGEALDPDSGLLHQAHEAWNALATLELALRQAEQEKVHK